MSDIKDNLVSYKRQPLAAEQLAELKALANKPASEIDLSDIAELSDDFFSNAKRGTMYRATKQQTTIRLDADILDWFKRHAKDGKGYQTDINKALRAYVEAQEQPLASKR